MEISTKRPPTGITDRAVQQLYDHLNEVIGALNQKPTKGDASHTEGKAGDIRLSKQPDGGYALQIKFEEGWVTSAKDVFNLLEKTGRVQNLVVGATTKPGTVGLELSDTGVTPGSYTNADITVTADGRITVAANGYSALTHQQIMSRIFLGA